MTLSQLHFEALRGIHCADIAQKYQFCKAILEKSPAEYTPDDVNRILAVFNPDKEEECQKN